MPKLQYDRGKEGVPVLRVGDVRRREREASSVVKTGPGQFEVVASKGWCVAIRTPHLRRAAHI